MAVHFKYPCKSCSKPCKNNQDCIFCEICNLWLHLNCTELSLEQFTNYAASDLPFYCIECLKSNLPLHCFNSDRSDFCFTDDLKFINNIGLDIDNIGINPYIGPDSVKNLTKDIPNSDLTIFYTNIRSLSKNLDLLEELLHDWSYLPDILAITETKLSSKSYLPLLKLLGYEFFHNDSITNAGGVGIYIKSGFHYKIRIDLELKVDLCESIWFEFESIISKSANFVVGVVYKHPACKIGDFQDSFEKTLEKLHKNKQMFYIVGDFNINLLECKTNNKVESYVNFLNNFNCLFCVDKPTRVTESSATLIDHFYSNDIRANITTHVVLTGISDHYSLFSSV